MNTVRTFLVLCFVAVVGTPAAAQASNCKIKVGDTEYTVSVRPQSRPLRGTDTTVWVWRQDSPRNYWARIDDIGSRGVPFLGSDNQGRSLARVPGFLPHFQEMYDRARAACGPLELGSARGTPPPPSLFFFS